jgi:hypothetical protein
MVSTAGAQLPKQQQQQLTNKLQLMSVRFSTFERWVGVNMQRR